MILSFNLDKDDATDTLDHVDYPKARLLPHFLNRNVIDTARKNIASASDGTSIIRKDFDSITSDPGICIYCPFSECCLYDVRSIDKERK